MTPSSFSLLSSLFLLLLASFAHAQVYVSVPRTHPTTTPTYPAPYPTSVWATGVVGGVTTVTLSPYTQTFSPMYSTIATPKSGSIGLGTISGTVGVVQPITYITISESASNAR